MNTTEDAKTTPMVQNAINSEAIQKTINKGIQMLLGFEGARDVDPIVLIMIAAGA